jgi:hypothetical protein
VSVDFSFSRFAKKISFNEQKIEMYGKKSPFNCQRGGASFFMGVCAAQFKFIARFAREV